MISRRRDEEPGPMLANRKLKQRRRRQIQKRCLKLHRTYSISFNSSNVGKLFRCCILKDCIEVLGNKKKVVRHFHVVVMQRRQRNVQKSVMHVQSCCFIFLNFCFFAVLVAVVVAPYYVCIKGVKRSWATDVNRKWGLFPLHMPWRYKICTPLLLYSYRDDLTCIAQKRLCLKLPMPSLNLSRHLVAQYMYIIGFVELGENPEPPSSYS